LITIASKPNLSRLRILRIHNRDEKQLTIPVDGPTDRLLAVDPSYTFEKRNRHNRSGWIATGGTYLLPPEKARLKRSDELERRVSLPELANAADGTVFRVVLRDIRSLGVCLPGV
jgi:hypothetical protein